MDNKRVISKIQSGTMSRADFVSMRQNTVRFMERAKTDADRNSGNEVLSALDTHAPDPISLHYNFMGFCPSGTIENRQDIEWKEKGICDFHFYDSKPQMEQFSLQLTGDWVILKKISSFGNLMQLFGFGKIRKRLEDENGVTYFEMEWNDQEKIIEVPLMGCNATINMRSIKQVDEVMDAEFWDWLSYPFG